jgi:hypothetical protein
MPSDWPVLGLVGQSRPISGRKAGHGLLIGRGQENRAPSGAVCSLGRMSPLENALGRGAGLGRRLSGPWPAWVRPGRAKKLVGHKPHHGRRDIPGRHHIWAARFRPAPRIWTGLAPCGKFPVAFARPGQGPDGQICYFNCSLN